MIKLFYLKQTQAVATVIIVLVLLSIPLCASITVEPNGVISHGTPLNIRISLKSGVDLVELEMVRDENRNGKAESNEFRLLPKTTVKDGDSTGALKDQCPKRGIIEVLYRISTTITPGQYIIRYISGVDRLPEGVVIEIAERSTGLLSWLKKHIIDLKETINEPVPTGIVRGTMENQEIENGDIWLMDGETFQLISSLTTTADCLNPKWSPDGKKIAYIRLIKGKGELWKLTLNLEKKSFASTQTRIPINVSESILSPVWSRNGEKIAFLSGESVWVAKADGSMAKSIASIKGIQQILTWSRNDKYIIFSTNSETDIPVLTQKSHLLTPGDLTIKPEDRDILNIWKVDCNTREKERLVYDVLWLWLPNISPDGLKLVFPFKRTESQCNLWLREGKKFTAAKPLTGENYLDVDPAWSPDGKWLVFVSNRNSRYLLDEVSIFQKWNKEEKEKYRDAIELYKQGKELFGKYKYNEASDCFDESLLISREIGYREGEANCLYSLGDVHIRLDDYGKARQHYEQALEIYREIKHRAGEARCLQRMGDVHSMLDDYERTQEYFEKARGIFKEINHRSGEARCLQRMGDVCRVLSDYEKARKHYEKALGIYREIKDRLGEANCLDSLGELYIMLNDYKKARHQNEKALEIYRKIKHRLGEANSLYSLGSIDVMLNYSKKARQHFEKALGIYIEIKSRLGEANCLRGLGYVSKELDDYEKARQHYEQAVGIYREIKDRSGEVHCLRNLGDVYIHFDDYEKARKSYEQVLRVYREIKHRLGEANSLISLGNVHSSLGEFEKARQHYEQALGIYKLIKHRGGEANCLHSFGILHLILDNYGKAQQYFEQALAIYRKIRDRSGEANCLISLGNVYNVSTDYEEARRHFEKALAIYREIKSRNGEAKCLIHLADMHLILTDYEKALQQNKQALEIYREIKHRLGEANCLLFLGDLHNKLANYEKARQNQERALKIYREIKHRLGEANCLLFLGDLHNKLANYEKARQNQERALKIYREIKHRLGEANCLLFLGNVYINLNDYKKAQRFYNQSFLLQKKIEDRHGMLWSYYGLGKTFEALKKYKKAESNYKSSIKIIEEIWNEMKLEEYKTLYFGSHVNPYVALIELLFKCKRGKHAFEYAQRSRSRTFLYLLGNKRIDPKKGVSSKLVRQEEKLKKRITSLSIRIREIQQKKTKQQISTEKLKSELLLLKQKHREIIQQIKLNSPEYASFVSVNSLSIEEIQALIRADGNTVLIEYYTTPTTTYLWVLDGKKIYSHKIEIDNKTLSRKIKEYHDMLSNSSFGIDTLKGRAQEFYDLLFKKVVKSINGKIYIAVVPHGVLHYLPFETLMKNGKFLTEHDIKIFYLPSASAYKYSKKKNQLKKERLIALGNPDGTLPFSGKEVEELKRLYSRNPEDTKIFTGKAAKESIAKSYAPHPDIFHCACHGEFNSANPMYSALLLAPDNKDDGRLEVHEIYKLQLKPAYLVTLSACQTNIGSINPGDEIIGLTRAFIYAGTSGILASLWRVDDYYTEKFMVAFYRALKETNKIEALHKARQEMIKEYGKRHPYYWSAFVLIGDPQ